MNPTLKTGLLAVGIVAVVVSIAAVVAVVVLVVPNLELVIQSTSPGSTINTAPADMDTLGRIANHRFWKQPLTAGQTQSLVGQLHALQGDKVAFVSDAGKITVSPEDNIIWLDSIKRDGMLYLARPEGVSKPYFIYDTLGDAVRPDPDRVAGRILFKLESAVFRP